MIEKRERVSALALLTTLALAAPANAEQPMMQRVPAEGERAAPSAAVAPLPGLQVLSQEQWEALGAGIVRTQEMQRYNVLQIVWDTTRADHLSLYGYPRATTPFVDSIADQAIVFGHCSASGDWTVPGVASIVTSLTVHTHKMFTQAIRLDDHWQTTAELLKAQSYRTCMLSSNPVVLGLDRNLDKGLIGRESSAARIRW